MGGVRLERKALRAVDNSELEGRVLLLEGKIPAMEERLVTVETTVTDVKNDTSEIIALIVSAKGAAGFLKKHGPRAIYFVTGILATLGIGNPDVLKFIQNFFGVIG